MEASFDVFLLVLGSGISSLPLESLTARSRHPSHEDSFSEDTVEKLIKSIQEFFNGEPKVRTSNLYKLSNFILDICYFFLYK